MTFDLHNMTINHQNVRDHLKRYLNNISTYNNFDRDMLLRVFVDNKGDFCAFEAVDYMLGFTSSRHKMSDIMTSTYVCPVIRYPEFINIVENICR